MAHETDLLAAAKVIEKWATELLLSGDLGDCQPEDCLEIMGIRAAIEEAKKGPAAKSEPYGWCLRERHISTLYSDEHAARLAFLAVRAGEVFPVYREPPAAAETPNPFAGRMEEEIDGRQP